MNIKLIVTTAVAIVLASGGLAFAQGSRDRNDRDRNDRGRDEQSQRDSQTYRQPDRRDANDGRRNDRGYQDRGYQDDRRYGRDGRGAGPNHSFYRGQRLPAQYRHRNYVVDDWRGHRLTAPPRGYHWVQTGGDYVLVAIATGIIAQLLLNR